MKQIYTLILALLMSSILFAQKPCTWGGDIAPVVLPADLVIDTCYRIPTGSAAPAFGADGIASVDNVWNAASVVPIEKRRPTDASFTSNPDPEFNAVSRFMYDEEWMYILVLISGDLEIDIDGADTEQDHVEFMFQNTWGGRGTASEHCDDANFAERYWEQDGDRKWSMPVNQNTNLVWLDQDVDDICGGNDCSGITGDDWLTYSALNVIKYNSYTGNDTIIYECAFHLKNWMKYSYTDVNELAGEQFGFDFSVRDIDGLAGMTDHINLNDPGNDAYAWTTVLGKFTFSSIALPPPPSAIENREFTDIKVFPNPALNYIKINSDLNISKVEISNIVGQVIITQNDVNSVVDISNLNKGIYIVNLYSGNAIISTKKLIKE